MQAGYRCGSFSDFRARRGQVRYAADSGHVETALACPKSANNCRGQVQQVAAYSLTACAPSRSNIVSAHIRGALVPVEEPSTASIAEVTPSFDHLVAGRRDQADHERAVERAAR